MVEVITIDGEKDYSDAVARAVSLVNAGGLIAFPTETVYGVGARADHAEGVARLRRLKERTNGRPFTVHIAEPDSIYEYVPNPPSLGRRLVRKGWPGPVTLLFSVADPFTAPVLRGRDAGLCGEIYYGGEIGLRCPNHEVARSFLRGAAGPIIAASANRAGRVPACTAEQAVQELGDGLDLVLDAGPADFGKPSTVVRVSETGYEVVREGAYDARTLRRLASLTFLFVCTGNTCRSPMAAALFAPMLARQLGCRVSELADRLIAVRSAGTFAMDGAKAAPEAIAVLKGRNVDLMSHTSTPLSVELIHQADRIYVMTRAHAGAVTVLVPSAEAKTQLLSPEGDIEDPIGGSVEVYESCAARIETALETRLDEVEL